VIQSSSKYASVTEAVSLSQKLTRYAEAMGGVTLRSSDLDRHDSSYSDENRPTTLENLANKIKRHRSHSDDSHESIPSGLVVNGQLGDLDASWLPVLKIFLSRSIPVRLFLKVPARPCNKVADVSAGLELLSVLGFRLFVIDDMKARWWSLDPRNPDSEQALSQPFRTLLAVNCSNFMVVSAFLHSNDLDGAERAHLELARSLQARGHLVHTLLPDLDGPLQRSLDNFGCTSTRHQFPWWVRGVFGEEWPHLGPGLVEAVERVRTSGTDVLLTQSSVVACGAVVAQMLKLPHVWFLHEWCDPDYGLELPVEDRQRFGAVIAQNSTTVVVNSELTLARMGYSEEIQIVAPIDIDSLETSETYPEHESSPTLAVIGGIHKAKGHEIAIRALGILRDSGVQAQLQVFGSGTPGDVASVQELVESLSLSDSVEFRGYLENPESEIQSVDIVLAPSLKDSFGRTPIEAILWGKPTIYSNGIGAATFLVDGVSGLEFEAGSPESLAAAVQRLVNDKSLWISLLEMGPLALRSCLAEYHLTSRMEQILQEARNSSSTVESLDLMRILAAQDADDAADARLVKEILISEERTSASEGPEAGIRRTPKVCREGSYDKAGRRLRDRLPIRLGRVTRWISDATQTQDGGASFGGSSGDHQREPRALSLELERRFFDEDWYLRTNPDVAVSGSSGWEHYVRFGAAEMRSPNSVFDSLRYVEKVPEAADSETTPFEHFLVNYGGYGDLVSDFVRDGKFHLAAPDQERLGDSETLSRFREWLGCSRAPDGRWVPGVTLVTAFASFQIDEARELASAVHARYPSWVTAGMALNCEPALVADAKEIMQGPVFDSREVPGTRWTDRIGAGRPREAIQALKATVMAHQVSVLGRTVIYLDPGTTGLENLGDLVDQLGNYSALVTPTLSDPADGEEDVWSREVFRMKHGVYDDGFFMVRAGTDGDRLARWLRDRMNAGFEFDARTAGATDQRWLDLVPTMFPDVKIIHETGLKIGRLAP
jgi:glycosyltransferase involved in cell wall biosynthesis